jgi:hypothetical protein
MTEPMLESENQRRNGRRRKPIAHLSCARSGLPLSLPAEKGALSREQEHYLESAFPCACTAAADGGKGCRSVGVNLGSQAREWAGSLWATVVVENRSGWKAESHGTGLEAGVRAELTPTHPAGKQARRECLIQSRSVLGIHILA